MSECGLTKEIEELYYLLDESKCPIVFLDEAQKLRAVKWLVSHGVRIQGVALPEEDYYVLRNTETGMYFRGKGANRWGKHFNQATIYRVKGTAEHSIKECAWHGEKAELVRIKIVEMPEPQKGE